MAIKTGRHNNGDYTDGRWITEYNHWKTEIQECFFC